MDGHFGKPLFPTTRRQRWGWYNKPVKPIVRWPGSKQKLLPVLVRNLPDFDYKAYHEPFLGGGSLFFYLRPERAYLYDADDPLMSMYVAVRDHLDRFERRLRIMDKRDSRKYFRYICRVLPDEKSIVRRGAGFMYLNRNSFRSVIYVSPDTGKLRGSWSPTETISSLNWKNLRRVSTALQSPNVKLINQSFEKCRPHRGHFYYFDPPYHTKSQGISYSKETFGRDKLLELADLCHRIDKVGGYFLMSNSDTRFVRKTFSSSRFNSETIVVRRPLKIALGGDGYANELLVRNY